MVQNIEPGGRIEKDGRLKVHDRIIEINGQDLHNVTFPEYDVNVSQIMPIVCQYFLISILSNFVISLCFSSLPSF